VHENHTFTRRRVLGAACALAASSLRAQPQLAAVHFREYARCLPDYLTGLAEDAYKRRKARIAGLTTAQGVRDYQAWAKRTFQQLAGPMPEQTEPRVRTIATLDRPQYTLQKVVYQTRPELFVTANLYLPKTGTAPYPGVLFQMGHATNGKGNDTYQRCCQGLVQLGAVVLAFDPIGQGERTDYPQANGWQTRLGSADAEHTYPGKQMLLLGETCSGAMVWDAMRSLDVLAAHPKVDPRRIISAGQSGGATLTQLLVAMDDRLAGAAVMSGNTENFATTPFFPPGSADDAEQDLVGSGPLGFDRWDLLWPIAPKPMLIGISAHDYFGTYSPSYEASGEEGYQQLLRAYSVLRAAGNLQPTETPLPHGLTYPSRVAVYKWFERFIKHSDREIKEEPPTALEKDETLWCGPTGNTVRDFGGRTAFVFTRERAHAIQTPARPADLRTLLAMDPPVPGARLEVRSTAPYRNCDIQVVEVNTAKQVWAPAWLFLPKRPWSRLLLLIEPNGRNGEWHEDQLYDRLASAGVAVCAADVRGVGDLEPQFSTGSPHYEGSHQGEEDYAWASLILGHSLLGQRTADIAGMARALAQKYPQATIVLAANEKMTVPALCAAALEPRIAKTYLSRHLVSWRSIAETENYSCPLANIVPGGLVATDLPEIARSLAPRIVTVAGAVDGAGRVVPRAAAPYADYREQPAWTFEVLSQL
jgi:cephalosporin-C deacetylase-like acetyl esterase